MKKLPHHRILFIASIALAIAFANFAVVRRSSAQDRRGMTATLPPPVKVCLLDGKLLTRQGQALPSVSVPLRGLASPSLAGQYDPNKIDPAGLNWSLPGVGCVTWPGSSTQHDRCGGGAGSPELPVVKRRLCWQ
ncbi:MAG TPA: hypothetical protein DF383_03185 [Deltaproteobacteria bacterium]|nr:hypothetical protein [Deltaproteobacteria bacterium]